MSLKFAIIGFGRIGHRHARAIGELDDCELVAYCDTVTSTDYPDLPQYDNLDQMLSEQHPDVVCVCSPNGLHAQHAIAALQAGVHVVCEKPLALDALSAERMVSAANEAEKHLVCMLQNRYSTETQWLRKIVEEGRLGEIQQVQVNCFWNRGDGYFKLPDGTLHPWHGKMDLDGGPIFTQFSHFVDLLIWLFGDLEVDNSMFRNFSHPSVEFEDAGKFDFTFGENGFGSFNYSIAVWDKNQESSITIIGSKGSVRLAGQYMNALEYCHVEGIDDAHFEEHKQAVDKTVNPNNHGRVIQNLVDAIRVNKPLDFDINDAVHGVRAIQEVYSNRSL